MATIALDWDGTLVDVDTQEWLPGALDALQKLLVEHTVILHTCRANWIEGLASIRARLTVSGIGYVKIWMEPGKPNADFYVDNQGVHFDGDWPAMLEYLGGTSLVPRGTRPRVKAKQMRRPAPRLSGKPFA